MVLVSHDSLRFTDRRDFKIFQDHVIKMTCDFIDRNLLQKVTILSILVAIGTLLV